MAHCHQSKDFKTIETKDIIFGYSPGKRQFENPGADDKNGIFICLECLKKYDTIKIAFFRPRKYGPNDKSLLPLGISFMENTKKAFVCVSFLPMKRGNMANM